MKKIFLLISAVAMLAACQRETNPTDVDGTTVEIRLSTGDGIAGGARTRAELGENDIATVDVLVFKRNSDYPTDPAKAVFQYSRYAWHKGSSVYNVALKEGTGVDLYFVINARETLEAALGANKIVADITKWADAQKVLILSGEIDRKTDGLPMWGHRYGESISTNSAANKFGTVRLLRAVATADVNFTGANNFILQEVSIEFASNQGKLAYTVDADNIDYNDDILDFNLDKPQYDFRLIAPEVPASTTTTGRIPYELKTLYSINPITHPDDDGKTSNNVVGELYFYENDANGENSKNYTKVVVKGKWDQNTPDNPNDDKVSYYPLAFRESTVYNNPDNPDDPLNGTSPRVPIIRNQKYQFQITKVNGNGYDNLEDAKNGADMNMTYKVVEWTQWDNLEIIMVEGMWVSFSNSRNENLSKTATLYRNAGSTDEIEITTNISLDKYKMTLPDGAAVTPESEGATPAEWAALGIVSKVANSLFTVTLVKNGTPTVNASGETIYYGKYIFEAKLPYAAANTSKVNVVAEMIKFKLDILQRNATPDDWGDGPDTGVDLR